MPYCTRAPEHVPNTPIIKARAGWLIVGSRLCHFARLFSLAVARLEDVGDRADFVARPGVRQTIDVLDRAQNIPMGDTLHGRILRRPGRLVVGVDHRNVRNRDLASLYVPALT